MKAFAALRCGLSDLCRGLPERLRALLLRGDTVHFSRSGYEVVFSVFMVALAYFYRENPLIAYPEVFYLFVSLLSANFAFNRILSERASVGLWLVDGMLAANIGIISAILAYSGGPQSYFWVLFLLPIFTAALTARAAEAGFTVLAAAAAVLFSGGRPDLREAAACLSFAVKCSVFVFSAFVIYRGAVSRRRLETEIGFKRFQVEKLLAAATVRDSAAELDASAAEVGRMTASLLHDIGNVIAVIMASSDMLMAAETPDKRDIKRVHQASRMAKSIIESSLSLIKGAKYDFRDCCLKDCLENALALFIRPARGKGVALKLEIEDALPALRASPPHIQRVVVNALSNSLSFLPQGGSIVVRAARRNAGEIYVTVTDDGPGFPESMLAGGIRQFGTTRKDSGGTGLGLFNSKEIVERHGGALTIRNAQPKGAVVEFTLPLPAAPAAGS